MEISCINCERELLRQETTQGVFWGCPGCGSKAASLKLLRGLLGAEEMNGFLHAVEQKEPKSGRHCPGCDREMRDIEIARDPQKVQLDVCLSCRMVWFDPEEHDQMSAIAAAMVLDVDWTEMQRRESADRVRREARRDRTPPPRPVTYEEPGPTEFDPMEFLPLVIGWLGLPIEEEAQRFKRRPLMTWGFAAICVLVSLVALFSGENGNAVLALGFMPKEPLRYGGITLFSSILVHGSLWHLFTNMYFLLIFGDNVEDELGIPWFLALIILSAWMGNALHAGFDPRPGVPAVGASGAISGILAYYAFKFPRASLAMMFRYVFIFKWFRFPAWVLFLVWVLLQLVTAYAQLGGQSHVSALAHLGGAVIGVSFWAYGRYAAGGSGVPRPAA